METLKQSAVEVYATPVEWAKVAVTWIAALILVIGAGSLVVSALGTFRFVSLRELYALQYWVPQANVVVDPKPHDCEFWKAPIGSKDCHYDRMANAVTERGQRYVIVTWTKKSD